MPPTRHILFAAFPSWGHTRPFCIFAARLVKEQNDIAFTMVVPPDFLQKVEDELTSELREPLSGKYQARIRVLSSFKSTTSDPFENVKQLFATYSGVYEDLTSGKAVSCSERGTSFEALPPPTAVILDFISLHQFQITKSITGNTVPVFAWATGHAPSIFRVFAPARLGGKGDIKAQTEAEAARLGITPEELGDKLFKDTTGAVMKLPGVPEMYDYEEQPQILPFEIPLLPIVGGASVLLKECDGILAASSHAWENEGIEALRSWFTDWNKELYSIGPLLPSSYGKLEQSSRGGRNVQEFLDRMLSERGEKSVVLISLGSVFWPKDTGYLEEVVDAMIEKGFPFILSHASPFASLTEEITRKVQESGIGQLTKWCPQQYVLAHPATGWFLSHCGHNSVTESLGSGIPIIAWPFEGDQPITAAHLESLNLAIELREVRTGPHASKPLHRSGKGAAGTREAVGAEIRTVIDICRGPRGAELQRNAKNMQARMAKAWDEEGPARRELSAFLKKYSLD
ncbi:UDP-Glycosyltransferase/glycogen phosphorylase [Agrocybe pediades]|nr:UDP-Glycosyltransferase/glycogen phosphorylase [Agrocybe pediades]